MPLSSGTEISGVESVVFRCKSAFTAFSNVSYFGKYDFKLLCALTLKRLFRKSGPVEK